MQESGGRRIKRSLNIDLASIRFLTDEEVEHFGKFALLKDYISSRWMSWKKSGTRNLTRGFSAEVTPPPHQYRYPARLHRQLSPKIVRIFITPAAA